MTGIFRKIIPSFLIDTYHFFLAVLSAFISGFPSRQLKIIGVTGTNGKSTTIRLIVNILEQAGYRVASLSSIEFKIAEKKWLNELRMTMPGRMVLQKFLKQALDNGCDYAVLEVTSEGIKQHRHRFIDFDVAVFTNLSPEHIEAHGGFKNYRKAKGKFFKKVKKTHVINSDDENADYFLQFPAQKKYIYKLKTQNSKLKTTTQNLKLIEAKNFQISPKGSNFSIKEINFNLKLLGKFNIYNALAAICLALSQGIDLEVCKRALEKVKGIPGRMELVIAKPFRVFVDYAFTPNALEQVYKTLITNYKLQTTKLICVLGSCGGGRDKWKRPALGELAAKYCNKVIVTNEDPYDEDPKQILLDIKSGIPKDKIQMTNLILDRRMAIKKSLELAKPRDVVVITGKGCEPSICVAGGKKIPWDDRKVIREEFQRLKNNI
jgi:UDP-N-acetylmuramoyl-L-alanyl-D-glutamate--2,6-diaminopimelate ligase